MEAFCENLGEEIVPYMDPLMEKLLVLLRTANRQTQVNACPALRLSADRCGQRRDATIGAYSECLRPLDRRSLPLRSWGLPSAGDGRLGDRVDRIGCRRQVPPAKLR